ncbi:MAG: fatty acid desaturase [Chthoniobacterales bacterium]
MHNLQTPIPEATPLETAEWKEIVRKYQEPSAWGSIWQIINTVGPYIALWVLAYFASHISYWLLVPIAILAGGFMIRTFIIFHDCTHGSFFKSSRANEIVGFITGVITFTPYHHWRWEHGMHHSTSGDLDRRGIGDVWTLTVQEYIEASRWKRFGYHLARNPFVLFVLAPLALFLVLHRLTLPTAKKRDKFWVHGTNVAILVVGAILAWIFGIEAYLIFQLTALLIGATAGVWLFYVQHQFEDVVWERGENWNFAEAAMHGSSFYKLPKILQWFSGNIGFHHIHHLSPRIPNYHLERAHNAEPLFQTVKPLTVRRSLKSLTLRLWDEGHQKLVTFKAARNRHNVQPK